MRRDMKDSKKVDGKLNSNELVLLLLNISATKGHFRLQLETFLATKIFKDSVSELGFSLSKYGIYSSIVNDSIKILELQKLISIDKKKSPKVILEITEKGIEEIKKIIKKKNISSTKIRSKKLNWDMLPIQELFTLVEKQYGAKHTQRKNTTDSQTYYKSFFDIHEKIKKDVLNFYEGRTSKTDFPEFGRFEDSLKLFPRRYENIAFFREGDNIINFIQTSLLGDKNFIPVIGNYGSGKSTLCYDLLYSLSKNKDVLFIPFYIRLANLRQFRYKDIKKQIYHYLNRKYKFKISFNQFVKILIEQPVVLILDGLDEITNTFDERTILKQIEDIRNLSDICKIVLTSRDSYFQDNIMNDLVVKDDLIKILDLDQEEVYSFITNWAQNENESQQIIRLIHEKNLGHLAKKPLFLKVICDHFERFEDSISTFSEVEIFEILIDAWISHDLKGISKSQRELKKKERILISEYLAMEEHSSDTSLSIKTIKKILSRDFDQYIITNFLHDTVNSTFLMRDENNTFSFILKSVREYFIAKKFLRSIINDDMNEILRISDKIKTNEIFRFIKLIRENESDIDIFEDFEFVNLRKISRRKFAEQIINIINIIKKEKPKQNLGSLVRILHENPGLFPRMDLSDLNLSGVSMPGANLEESSLRSSDLSNSNLQGSNLKKANLQFCNLTNSNLRGVQFEKSKQKYDLTYFLFNQGQFRENAFYCELSNSILKNADLRGADLSGIRIAYADLRGADLRGCILVKADLENADLTNADLQGADLEGAEFEGAMLNKTKVNGTILEGIDISLLTRDR